MAWKLKGRYTETCSCDLICPCNATFDHGATYDYCRVVLVFEITEGDIDGTDIAGVTVAAIADTPKVMTEGNWKLGVFVDENASEEQADKLVKVFTGQLGGPMAGLAPLVGEMAGVERAAIEIDDDGVLHRVRVGDAIDFEIKDIVPFGVETGQPVRFDGMFHPVAPNLTIAEATRSRINAFGIEYGLSLIALSSAFAAAAWWWTVGQMRGMDAGPWTSLGTLGWFLGVWVVMMAAMMFPSIAPTVALYARMTRERSQFAPAAFTAGYLGTWAVAGVA